MNSLVVLLSVVALAAAKPSGLFNAGVVTYSAPIIAAAPAAVSHQSRVDIKSSPAVVATAAIAPAVRTVFSAPVVAAAPAAVSHQSRVDFKSSPAVVSTVATVPVAYTAVAPAVVRSALVAPWTVAAPAVPLDTPEVVAARAAHFQALAEAHSIHKRSLIASAPLVSTYAAAPVAYSSHVAAVAPVSTYAIHTPVLTRAYGVHPW